MVICGGEVIEIIHSQFGTQQGDVMGTSYFGFATMQFAEELAELVPDAQISWIVDDLTVAGSVEEMGKVARFIKESGPQYGLIMAPKPAPCSCARCAGGSEVGFEDEVDAGVWSGEAQDKELDLSPRKRLK